MTAHDMKQPTTTSRPDATSGSPVTRASLDKVTVIVWRITTDAVADADTAVTSDAGDSPLTPRLARHLVAIYSDVHGTVIDFDADAKVRHAAETTGRHYLAVTDPSGATAAAGETRPAELIILSWPRPGTTTGQDATNLLNTCRQHLTRDGSTIVVAAAAAGAAGTRYGEYEQVLLTAAQAAGLRHLHDIVLLHAEDDRDAFTYTTAPTTTAAQGDSDSHTPRPSTRATLAIFGHQGRRT
jgi:hypothetical protein